MKQERQCAECGETLTPGQGLYCPRCGQARRQAGLKKAISMQPPAAEHNHCLDCGKRLSDTRARRCRACSARHNGKMRLERERMAANVREIPPSVGLAINEPVLSWDGHGVEFNEYGKRVKKRANAHFEWPQTGRVGGSDGA